MPPGRFTPFRPPTHPAAQHALATAGAGHFGGPHPGIQPPPKPLPAKRPAKPKSQTVSQAANAQVNQQLAPVLAQQGQFNTTQNAAIQSFALALLGKLQPVAGQVGSDYDKAIGQTAALSGATAEALRNANPNQQDQQLLQSINAPGAQQAQVASKLANTFGGGAAALQFTQGEVPGSMLASNKASAQTEARQLPGIAALKGQQDLASALNTQGQTRASTLAQRPALYQQAVQTIKGNNAAKSQAAFEQYKFETARADAYQAAGMKAEADAARHNADLAYKYASLGSQNQRSVNSIEAQNQRQQKQIDAANARQQKQIDASNKQVQMRIDAAAKKAAKTGAAKEYPNLTKAQVTHLRSGVAHAFYGLPEQKDVNDKVVRKAMPPVSYQEAITEAVKAGYSRAAATKMVNRFYTVPGQRGRPLPSKQAKKAKQTTGKVG